MRKNCIDHDPFTRSIMADGSLMDLQKETYRQAFAKNKCCVIIPTYNNASSLRNVIEGVLSYTDEVLVVNDGSTDATMDVLAKFQNLLVVSYPVNKGKGFALRSAFEAAWKAGYENAITIDSDGQHQPDDLPKFLSKMEEMPQTIIIGARNMDQATVPGKSSFGHKFSNFWFWFETGIQVPDTQSGYRLYPLKGLQGMKWYSTKYEFEIEVIVRAVWKGIHIDSVPVSVYYAPKETRVSHFRPFKDFSRVSVLNVMLVMLTLVYYKPRELFRMLKKKSLKEKVKTHLFNPNESDWKKTCSIMFGIFMGIFPVWGYQLLIGIALAHIMRLNKVLFVLAAHISIPPMIPVIIFLSYHLGGQVLGNPDTSSPFSKSFSIEMIRHNMIQYIVGSILLALLTSAVVGLFSFSLLKLFPLKKGKPAFLPN